MENQSLQPIVKPAIAYIVGVITTAVAVSAGSGRWGLICFALGILSTLVLAGYLLSRPRIARRVAQVLLRVASPQEFSAKAQRASKREIRAPKPELKETKPETGRTFAQTVLALRGLKCDPETARWATGQATQRLPEDAGFEQTFRLALNIATSRA
jgi:hypothetical protein